MDNKFFRCFSRDDGSGDKKMYWSDALNGRIGRADIGDSTVISEDPNFITSIAGIKGLIAVDTNYYIGLCRYIKE